VALARPRNVLLVTAGDDAEARALSLVARDLLRRLDVGLEDRRAPAIDPRAIVERPATFPPALARAWIDLAPDDHATLYLVDEAWERVLVRRVARDPAHLEVAREELGHILETAVEAMLAGARLGVERQTLAPKLDTRADDAPTEDVAKPARTLKATARPTIHDAPPVRLHAGVFEQIVAFSSEVPVVHALGISAALESDGPLHPAAWLGLGYRWPTWAHGRSIGVKLQAVELRLLGRLSLWSRGPWRIDAALGPGVDLTFVSPVAERAGVALTRPSTDASFMVRGALSARWSALSLSFVMDVDTTLRDYAFDQDGRPVVVLAPFRARPGLVLEASTL
jgi:hypothetical protein